MRISVIAPRRVLVITALLLVSLPSASGDDCNGNRIDDVVEIEAGVARDCNANGVPDECEVAPADFSLEEVFPVASTPLVAVSVDFDGDGEIDLLTGNRRNEQDLPSTVSLLAGRPGNRFAEAVHFDAGSNLVWLAVGDLDGDGDPDLIGANVTAVSILLNRRDGTLEAPVSHAVEHRTRFVTAADLDGDGFPEVVTANDEADSISILPNRGDATFSDAVPIDVGRHPISVVGMDIDADADVDLLVSNRDASTISVLLNTGDRTFPEVTEISSGAAEPFAVQAIDLDRDRDPDVVAAGPTSVAVLLNEGRGRLAPPRLFHFPGKAGSLAAGDFDGDGDPDVAVGIRSRDSAIVLFNDGTGSLTGSASLEASRSRSIIACDLDGDGDLDLAVVPLFGPSSVRVRWNDEAEPRPELTFDDPAVHAVTGRPHGASVGDIDRDGDLDVVTGNNDANDLTVLRNRGDGTFARPISYPTGGNPETVVLGDLDLDGHLDVAAADTGRARVQILINSGSGTFPRATNYPVGNAASHLELADLDGDHDLDVIASVPGRDAVTILSGPGDGTFPDREDISIEGIPVGAASADLDGDGDLDLAVALSGASIVAVLTNEGAGHLVRHSDSALIWEPRYVAAGDLDRDGHVDLATANGGLGSVSLLWNRGDATFETTENLEIRQSPLSVSIVDLNDDGRHDLLTASAVGSVSVFVNGDRRAFFDPVTFEVGAVAGPRFVLAGDMNGDSTLDVISANRNSRDVSILLNRTTTTPGLPYLQRICTEVEFSSVSVASRTRSSRSTKYTLPARDDPELLPPLFQNADRFPLHEEFLRAVFPDRFGMLTVEEYDQLVGRRATRDYFVGALTRVRTESGFLYAFTVVADTGFDSREVLGLDEIRRVHETMSRSFELRPLAYEPDTEHARRQAESWDEPPFPVYFGDERREPYEAYTLGTGYGVVRLLELAEFEERNDSGRLTFQDIVVVDQAPRDIEGVVGGVITAEPQGELSHVAIRTARRGTPNAYIADALTALSQHQGKLVRLEVSVGEYSVTEVSPEEAEEFWSTSRPRLPDFPLADPECHELDHLLEIDLEDTEGGIAVEARVGGKAANFARLQQLLDGDYERYREPGFAIPMCHYLEFMRSNSLTLDGRTLTYEEYLAELFESPGFRTDSRQRYQALEEFRDLARRDGAVDSKLIEDLARRITEVFGPARMVRFRSSSNIEDALEFNGAGLYESTSVCAADTLDPVALDSSHCDPTRSDSRPIERALKKVWASLWTFRAHEERAYYQIPQHTAAMGLLVTRAFLDEVAGGVAFTGNPRSAQDRRYVITAQRGEESVVSPEPGISAERNLLEVEDGEVVSILRDRSSSLVPPGENVLSDEQLRELGAFMWHVDQSFPIDLEGHERGEVLLDFEFKIEPDGSLAVKQVRPFLLPTAAPPAPVFELVIPEGTAVCGVFSKERLGREPRVEYEMKSTARFASGRHVLSTGASTFSGELLEEVLFGPEKLRAEPDERGVFRVVRIADADERTIYRFSYTQRFSLPDGKRLEVRLFGLDFHARGGVPVEEARVLDEQMLIFELSMTGVLDEEPVVSYSSCAYDLLPLWEIAVESDDGLHLDLAERFLPSENDLSTGPASLRRADIRVNGERRTVTDYWRLVYTARRHNQNVRYWMVLDPPLELPAMPKAVHVIEFAAAEPTTGDEARLSYLDESFQVLGSPGVLSARKERAAPPTARFLRGDVSSDGTVDASDAISLLEFLFRRGRTPICPKAADADDDGRLSLNDAIGILLHLFGGQRSLPEPSTSCGVDPTSDELTCESFEGC